MFVARPVVSRLLQQTVRRYHDANFKPPTMDEMPIPQGSWQSHYDNNQKRLNTILVGGVGFAVATIVIAKVSGLVYLNYSPPKSLD